MGAARHLQATVAVAIAALLGAACGKDKPAEPAEPEPAAVSEEPSAGEAPAEEPGDKPSSEEPKEPTAGEEPGATAEHADPKTSPDDPKARLRAARERGERGERPGRRPRPLRDPGAERPARTFDNGAEPGDGAVGAGGEERPGEATPGEPVVAEAPTPIPGPTPGAPVEGDPATPALPHAGEPTPAAPGPSEPAQPAFEIRNDAAAIDATKMLPLTTVTEVLGKQLAVGVALPGIANAAGYGSIFYAAAEAAKAKGPEAFGVALQVWQDPTRREAEDRFRRMRLQYPNAEDVSVLVPLKAFYAYFGGIQSLTWVDPAKRMVMSLTCGEGLCSHDAMTRLAKSARERM